VAQGSEGLQASFHEEFRAGSHAAGVLGRVLKNDLTLVLVRYWCSASFLSSVAS
jgi:hypothetical protein